MQVEIIQNGKVLREHTHEGKKFIEVPSEGEYTIRLSNRSGSKRMAVLSVDGINVLDGEKAGYQGPGYVLSPWQTAEIKGWRRSDSEVAAFKFDPKEASYSAQTGKGTANTGVIGVAVFDEKPRRLPLPVSDKWGKLRSVRRSLGSEVSAATDLRARSCVTNDPHPPDCLDEDIQDLGTSYGQRATMYTTTTTFDRMEQPSMVLSFQYALREKLIQWGVPVPEPIPSPEAFPESAGPFVQAPPGWRG